MARIPVAHKVLILKAQAAPEALDLAALLLAAAPVAPAALALAVLLQAVVLEALVPVALPGWKNLPPKLANIPSG